MRIQQANLFDYEERKPREITRGLDGRFTFKKLAELVKREKNLVEREKNITKLEEFINTQNRWIETLQRAIKQLIKTNITLQKQNHVNPPEIFCKGIPVLHHQPVCVPTIQELGLETALNSEIGCDGDS